jgi:Zn-finger nucleic acid-binding protein
MKCPVDNETLVMTERSGVEIDYCPKCRGVWLDRGELDKIIDRAAQDHARETDLSGRQREESSLQTGRTDYRRVDREHERATHDPFGNRRPEKKRRESFLGDLFDF